MTGARVRAGTAADRGEVLELLERASLPTQDLGEATAVRFWVAEDDHRLVGAIGLERFGVNGLLRSLVVAPEYRNRGLGRALVETLERDARPAGVGLLVLLTQGAQAFFAHRGYAEIDRGYVPDEVQASAEFRSLCPASAACMMKLLQDDTAGASHG
jgi:N-acetylglutamate synthase-like GNAT family acetyltransferase